MESRVERERKARGRRVRERKMRSGKRCKEGAVEGSNEEGVERRSRGGKSHGGPASMMDL